MKQNTKYLVGGLVIVGGIVGGIVAGLRKNAADAAPAPGPTPPPAPKAAPQPSKPASKPAPKQPTLNSDIQQTFDDSSLSPADAAKKLQDEIENEAP